MFDIPHQSKIENDKIQRWTIELSSFSFDIQHSREQNMTADVSSSLSCVASVTAPNLHEPQWFLCHSCVNKMLHLSVQRTCRSLQMKSKGRSLVVHYAWNKNPNSLHQHWAEQSMPQNILKDPTRIAKIYSPEFQAANIPQLLTNTSVYRLHLPVRITDCLCQLFPLFGMLSYIPHLHQKN